jgi:hypothetical protein
MLLLALVICGTVRNYKENYITWKKYLLDLFQVDIFFHTYDVPGYKGGGDGRFDIREVVGLLNPKKYMVDNNTEKIKDFRNSVVTQCLRRGAAKPEFIKAQLYSIYMANRLKQEYEQETGIEYDLVIKIRFDTIFCTAFDISDIMTIYSAKNIILCGNPTIKTMKYKEGCKKCIHMKQKCDGHTDICDIVLMSRSKIMDWYANIYTMYDKYIAEMCSKFVGDTQYLRTVYPNGARIYYDVPKSECPYPEKMLALHLKDYVLWNFNIAVDTNRKII